MNTVILLLNILELALNAVKPIVSRNSTLNTIDESALALEKIVEESLKAYQDLKGKPMDISTLQPITPVE